MPFMSLGNAEVDPVRAANVGIMSGKYMRFSRRFAGTLPG